ncbi:hypothetical protein GCM10010123_02410 [Pilimelia anulata]|uniref:Uncharacterized protein n=1 Tax=Pilimelia anulata TaxID=53371 RepID=A0A8J3B3G4_9ACTN|nr:hypothetical protein [Pilimelia anulata]GGJ75967.1 hypothetical protein GCM10010123_02410 [Pilimelia anulata]
MTDGTGGHPTAISRRAVLARARAWWLRRDALTYSQEEADAIAGPDGTHRYRLDCSGFVSMALDLRHGTGPDTDELATDRWTTPIPRSALRPGDLLDNVEGPFAEHHVLLFAAWRAHPIGFAFYHFGGGGLEHCPHATFTQPMLANHPADHYRALRPHHVTD